MSSSCRKPAVGGSAVLRRVAVSAIVALPASTSFAAQTYYEPKVELRAEHNSNYGLVPAGDVDTETYGYIADAEVLIGIATPRSETSIRPRVKFQEYPDIDDLTQAEEVTPVEGFLDLVSKYRWERADARIIGRYSRQDAYSVETPSGVFDPLDPLYGSDPDTVGVRVGRTRDRFQLQPTFSYAVTERVRAGVGFDYQLVRYDSEGVQTQLDYDYAVLDGFATWTLNPVSDVTVGAYASKYETQDDISKTDTVGGRVDYRYRWSELTGFEAALFYEQDDITDTVPVRTEQSTSGWGGMVTAYRKHEVSGWRFTMGRKFIPTSDARKAELDQFRLQYDRDLTQRLRFLGSARYESRNSQAPTLLSDDRDYARADLSLQWFFAPTWYVSGGYSYIWEDREQAPDEADNNQVFLAVGYRGLARQRYQGPGKMTQ